MEACHPLTLDMRIDLAERQAAAAARSGNVDDRGYWMSKLAALREERSAREPPR